MYGWGGIIENEVNVNETVQCYRHELCGMFRPCRESGGQSAGRYKLFGEPVDEFHGSGGKRYGSGDYRGS